MDGDEGNIKEHVAHGGLAMGGVGNREIARTSMGRPQTRCKGALRAAWLAMMTFTSPGNAVRRLVGNLDKVSGSFTLVLKVVDRGRAAVGSRRAECWRLAWELGEQENIGMLARETAGMRDVDERTAALLIRRCAFRTTFL